MYKKLRKIVPHTERTDHEGNAQNKCTIVPQIERTNHEGVHNDQYYIAKKAS